MRNNRFFKSFSPYRIILFICILSFLSGEAFSFQFYEDIQPLHSTDFGKWTKTDIYIPAGAVVAVMAKGEIWDIRKPHQWRWQPFDVLRFKIGEEGREISIDRGVDRRTPLNVNVVSCEEGGYLILGMGTWWRYKNPETKRGKILLRMIVWEKDHRDRIEEELFELVRSHPKDEQIRGLVGYSALCFGQRGEYQKVQNLYKIIQENLEFDWDRVYPMVLNQLSDFEIHLGRYEKAKAYLQESLKRIKGFDNPYMESLVLRRLGTVASRLKEYENANQFFEKALHISIAIKNREAIGTCLLSMGWNLLRMDRPVEAEASFQKAIQVFKQRDKFLSQRRCYLGLGECYIRLNRIGEAKVSFETALAIGVKASDPTVQWQSHSWLGRIAEKEEDYSGAFEHYEKSIRIIETMRAQYTDPTIKALFMKDKIKVYERMIQLLYKMQRAPEALHYLERARARVMLEMLAGKAFSSKNREENELLIQERTLRRQIEELSMREERIGLEGPEGLEGESLEGKEIAKSLNNKVELLRAKYKTILERIERLNPELASLITINPLKASEIQSLLEGDTALLEYFIGVEGRYVFVITSQKVLAVPLKVDAGTIFEKIREFRRRAVEGITLDRLLTKVYERPLIDLHEILMKPVMEELSGKKHLVIVPHGMLHYLPFQALLSKEGRYLIESFTISYLPSASVLKYARAKNKGNRSDLFAVGNPSTGLPPLPAAEVEVKEVSILFEKNRVLTGEQATKTAVKDYGTKYDLMLISTHGEMIESNPLKSNLRFAISKKDDGKLTVSEIFDLEIKANLVTLSACETGLVKGEAGDFPQGDDLVGLSRAFIHAGAPSVVASLWKVSDDSTVQIMKNFYQNMRTLSKAEALRKAQLDLMRSTVRFTVTRAGGGVIQPSSKGAEEVIECSHPFFWAPFVLLGDWR